MQEGKIYAYYRPSFINGFEGFVDKDIYFELLQAVEGVARDQLTFLGLNEEVMKEIDNSDGLVTPEIARKYFD